MTRGPRSMESGATRLRKMSSPEVRSGVPRSMDFGAEGHWSWDTLGGSWDDPRTIGSKSGQVKVS